MILNLKKLVWKLGSLDSCNGNCWSLAKSIGFTCVKEFSEREHFTQETLANMAPYAGGGGRGRKEGRKGRRKEDNRKYLCLMVLICKLLYVSKWKKTGYSRSRFSVVSTQNTGFILALLFLITALFSIQTTVKLFFPTLYYLWWQN